MRASDYYALSRSPALKLRVSLLAWAITTLAASLALTMGGDPRIIFGLVLFSMPAGMLLLTRSGARLRIRSRTGPLTAYRQARQRVALEKTIDLVAFDIRRIADKEYYEEFLAKYFLTMESFVRLSRKNIVVLDYLAHHRSFNAIHDRELARSYERYFRGIEGAVAGRNLSYTRIMQLPLGEGKDLNREDLIRRCVELMFVETLEHIKRLYESTCDFELYILGVPLRPYSYMIVDGRYLLSEYDRYNRAGVSLPDHLIVDRSDSGNRLQDKNVRLLIDHHAKQLEAVVLTKEPISLEEVHEAVLRLEFNKSDLALQSRGPEDKEKIKKGIEKKQSVFAVPNQGLKRAPDGTA